MALPKRPTDLAKVFFDRGFDESLRARHALDFRYTESDEKKALFELIQSVGSLHRGLSELSTGIRAVYLAIESLGGTSEPKSGGMSAALTGKAMGDLLKNMQAAQVAHSKAVVDSIIKASHRCRSRIIDSLKKAVPMGG